MTKNYTKPIVTIDSGMAEGVYAASGCYTASAYIHQTPENGRGDYRIMAYWIVGAQMVVKDLHRQAGLIWMEPSH